jgi:hypothetical protein
MTRGGCKRWTKGWRRTRHFSIIIRSGRWRGTVPLGCSPRRELKTLMRNTADEKKKKGEGDHTRRGNGASAISGSGAVGPEGAAAGGACPGTVPGLRTGGRRGGEMEGSPGNVLGITSGSGVSREPVPNHYIRASMMARHRHTLGLRVSRTS